MGGSAASVRAHGAGVRGGTPGRLAGALGPARKILPSPVFPAVPRPDPGPEQPEPPSGGGPAQLRRRLQPETKLF